MPMPIPEQIPPPGAPPPAPPEQPSQPAWLGSYGHRLRSILGGGDAERLTRILQNIYGRNPEGLSGLMGGQHMDIFGLGDLRRVKRSGLARGRGQAFLDELVSRLTGQFGEGGGEPPGGGGGGGGEGGGAGGDAFGGRIGNVLNQLLNRRDVNALPPELRTAMVNQLLEIFDNPGFPPEILRALQNQARTTSATREQELLQRRSGEFNARGLFGSGPQVRALEDIESGTSEDLLNSMNQIGFANAQAAVQQIQNALQGTGILGQLGLGEEQLSSNELLRGLQLAISRELGLGDLGLRSQQFELERAIQELLLNLNLLSGYSAVQ